jgi:hypothetical protein
LLCGGEVYLLEPSKKRESRQINDEGELIGAVFCGYCGGLNPANAAQCEHCHEHIADQGPDLRSRLQRIHRHASNSRGFSDIADSGIGSVPNVRQERYERYEPPAPKPLVSRLSPGAILTGSLLALCVAVFFIPTSGPTNPGATIIAIFTVISFGAFAMAVISELIDSISR